MPDIILPPLVRKSKFENISIKSVRPAKINITLYDDPKYPVYYVESSGNAKRLVGYHDPKTGLFVTNESLHDQNAVKVKNAKLQNKSNIAAITSVIGSLHYKLYDYAIKKIEPYIELMNQKRAKDQNKYDSLYKKPEIIAEELLDYVNDTGRFMADIYKQIRYFDDRSLPDLDDRILYKDGNASTIASTARLNILDPKNQILTDDQKSLVEKFLTVFFDDYNMKTFSWMMGAVLLNIPIWDERISRYFLIYSEAGGVGKSTLMQIMIDGLLTNTYAENTPEFDKYFLLGDRFASSSMTHKRLAVYDEAVFNGPREKEKMHDLSGLNDAAIKTFATSGRLNVEGKYKDARIENYYNIHVILTNFLPQIEYNRTDLRRRFIDCMLKPTSMQEKAKQLGNKTIAELVDYVRDNAQAFANYFANTFMKNPKRFIDYMYTAVDIKKTEDETTAEYHKSLESEQDQLKKLSAFELFSSLAKKNNIDISNLLSDIKLAMPKKNELSKYNTAVVKYTNPNNKDLHFEIDYQTKNIYLYINSSRNVFTKYANLAFRQDLLSLYDTMTKFRQRVVKIRLNTL